MRHGSMEVDEVPVSVRSWEVPSGGVVEVGAPVTGGRRARTELRWIMTRDPGRSWQGET